MIINYKKLRDALEDYGVCKTIKDATGKPAALTVSTGSLIRDEDITDAVSASLDYAATMEEAEALQDEIERLQERQRALAAGVYLHNMGGVDG